MSLRQGSWGRTALQLAQTVGTMVSTAYGGPWAGAATVAGHAAFWAWHDSATTKFDDVVNRQDRIIDTSMQTSTLGTPIPQVWGKIGGLAGNIIWATEKEPHERREEIEPEDSGGKGGPTGPTQVNISITYTASYAIALCDTRLTGPIAGISKIWENNNLLFDAVASGPDSLPDGWTFHPGTATQAPDITMTAALGGDNVTRYPYLCYVVVTDKDLGQSGQTPIWNFELYQEGLGDYAPLTALARSAVTGDFWTSVPAGEAAFRFDKDTAEHVDSIPVGSGTPGTGSPHWPLAVDSGGIVWFGDMNTLAVYRMEESSSTILTTIATKQLISNIVFSDGDAWVATQDFDATPDLTDVKRLDPSGTTIALTTAQASWVRLCVGAEGSVWGAFREANSVQRMSGSSVTATIAVTTPIDLCTGADGHIWVVDFSGSQVRRIDPASNTIVATVAVGTSPVAIALASDGFLWTANIGNNTISRINPATNTAVSYGVGSLGSRETPYQDLLAPGPSGAMWVINSTANTVTRVSTAGVTLSAGTAMGPISILAGDTDSVWVTSFAGRLEQFSDAGVLLASSTSDTSGTSNALPTVVTTLCNAVGLTDIDVSELPADGVHMLLLNIEAARVPLEQLALAYRFYAVESGFTFKFRQRGAGALVFSIPEDELGAGEDQADEQGLRVQRLQEADLPTSIEVTYIDPAQNYQRNTQPGQLALPASGVENARSFNVGSLALSADTARQLAYEQAVEAWVQREPMQSTVRRKYANLEPGDRGTITARGLTYTVVLHETTYGAPGLLEFTARPDAAYIRNAIVAPPGVVTPPVPVPTGLVEDTTALLLNLPALHSTDIAPRYHWAPIGETEPWPGGALYRSIDNEASYQQVDSAVLEGITGTVSGTVPAADWHVLDTTTTITVTLEYGTLSSIPDSTLYNGGNLCAIGEEILGFGVATLIGTRQYELTRLLRGRRGTEWAVSEHGADETFVRLDAGVRRVGMENSDINVERFFKSVTVRQNISDVTGVEFTPMAANQIPWTTASNKAAQVGADWRFTWYPRSRFNGPGHEFDGIAFDPDFDAFWIKIYDDATYTTVVRSILTDGGEPLDANAEKVFLYTEAMQSADFGSAQSTVFYRVYQYANNRLSHDEDLVAA